MSKGICFGCGCWFDNLEEHHIFGGVGRREISDRLGLTVKLCPRCHRLDRNSAHRSGATALRLHKYGEEKMIRAGWTAEEFIAVVGKNYLDEDELEQIRLDMEAEAAINEEAFVILEAAAELPY